MARALVIVAILLAACGQEPVGLGTFTATPSATPAPTPTPTPTPEASPTPTETPTPEAAAAPEIAAFSVLDNNLMVWMHNPNERVGLIRAGFELTALGADGTILGVFGTEGLPGASCCTIYQLPPGGDFGLSISLRPEEAVVAQVELVATSPWIEWSTAEVPEVQLSDLTVQATDYSGPRITGRVTVPAAAAVGPFNVRVAGYIQSPSGPIVVTGSIDCVSTPDARAFEAEAFLFGSVTGPYTLQTVVAYTTTVPGVTGPAPGC